MANARPKLNSILLRWLVPLLLAVAVILIAAPFVHWAIVQLRDRKSSGGVTEIRQVSSQSFNKLNSAEGLQVTIDAPQIMSVDDTDIVTITTTFGRDIINDYARNEKGDYNEVAVSLIAPAFDVTRVSQNTYDFNTTPLDYHGNVSQPGDSYVWRFLVVPKHAGRGFLMYTVVFTHHRYGTNQTRWTSFEGTQHRIVDVRQPIFSLENVSIILGILTGAFGLILGVRNFFWPERGKPKEALGVSTAAPSQSTVSAS